MSTLLIESLENRRMLASARLSAESVEQILAAAGSQATDNQIVAVVDREGQILGILGMRSADAGAVSDEKSNLNPLLGTLVKAVARARTAAFFASTQDAFTTRTARFIIQDHFPHPVPNTPGGPLYGVQFSSLPLSDVFGIGPAISGDPGGIPLFRHGQPVGGIGVAGDGSDTLARIDLPFDPAVSSTSRVFDGQEENDFDEQVALAGAVNHMAPKGIRATDIFLDGLRLPFANKLIARENPTRTLADIVGSGDGQLLIGNAAATGGLDLGYNSSVVRRTTTVPYPTATFAGFTGELKNTNASNFGIIDSNDADPDKLTRIDVKRIFTRATRQALITRAAIRQEIGVPAQVHIAVVDLDGDILGVFRMNDGTNFSYDVAVQKARTATYFSDNDHAFSSRAVGFLSQRYFPAGIDGGFEGPLFQLQNALSLSDLNNRASLTPKSSEKNPLRNGITIFPGGFPLYKNGKLVGGIGISGDGVDQDDIIGFAGTLTFRPDKSIRSDSLPEGEIVTFIKSRVNDLNSKFNLSSQIIDISDTLEKLDKGLEDVQLPYVKFPRNPDV